MGNLSQSIKETRIRIKALEEGYIPGLESWTF